VILVLGGGFGLYGHLAALAGMDVEVAAPARYRPLLLDRPELADLDRRIDWVDEEAATSTASHVVLARRPQDNASQATTLADAGYRGSLVIEKPIAPTPEAALALGERLCSARIGFAVPYLFLHCAWTDSVRNALARNGARVEIEWAFRQSARVLQWKRTPDEGGGNLAYYFIHCIALAEALLPGAAYRWSYDAGNSGSEAIALIAECASSTLSIAFDQMRGETHFAVRADGVTLFANDTPFGPIPRRNVADPRISVLQRFYRADVFGVDADYRFQGAVARHWQDLARHIDRARNTLR